MAEETSLADNPKRALEDFLLKVHQEYQRWYERSHRRILWTWFPLHLLALFSGFATAILAALITEEAFRQFGIMRLLLVLLPAVGAAASTVAVQARLNEWCQLRESGRRASQNIYNEGRARFAAAKTEQEYSAIHNDLVKRLDAIEEVQSAGWVSLTTGRSAEKDQQPKA